MIQPPICNGKSLVRIVKRGSAVKEKPQAWENWLKIGGSRK